MACDTLAQGLLIYKLRNRVERCFKPIRHRRFQDWRFPLMPI